MNTKPCILLLLIPILLSAQCGRKLATEKCVPPNPITIRDFVIQLNDQNIPVHNAKITWVDSIRGIQKAEEIGLDSLTFNGLFSNLLKDFNGNKFLYVIYVNGMIKEMEEIKPDNIKAIAVYYNEEIHYWFKLFIQERTSYKELEALTGKTYVIAGTSLNTIAEKIIFKEGKAGSLIYIDKFPPYANSPNNTSELLFKRIAEYVSKMQ